jgi:hypothetical protein
MRRNVDQEEAFESRWEARPPSWWVDVLQLVLALKAGRFAGPVVGGSFRRGPSRSSYRSRSTARRRGSSRQECRMVALSPGS